jgi:hypothetical protein
VWAEADPRPLLFYFEVFGLTRHDVSLSVWADQSRFPAAEVEDFLFAVERLLVAAERRNVPARDISDMTGIRPVLRDASWRRIDSCWVELPAVQRLLDDVAASLPGIDAAQVFYARDIAGTQTAESLVAYVSAADDKITPEILRDPPRAMPAAAGRPPHCDGARLVRHLRPDPGRPGSPGVVARSGRPGRGLRSGVSF